MQNIHIIIMTVLRERVLISGNKDNNRIQLRVEWIESKCRGGELTIVATDSSKQYLYSGAYQ